MWLIFESGNWPRRYRDPDSCVSNSARKKWRKWSAIVGFACPRILMPRLPQSVNPT
jgi:hypothetical protein